MKKKNLSKGLKKIDRESDLDKKKWMKMKWKERKNYYNLFQWSHRRTLTYEALSFGRQCFL